MRINLFFSPLILLIVVTRMAGARLRGQGWAWRAGLVILLWALKKKKIALSICKCAHSEAAFIMWRVHSNAHIRETLSVFVLTLIYRYLQATHLSYALVVLKNCWTEYNFQAIKVSMWAYCQCTKGLEVPRWVSYYSRTLYTAHTQCLQLEVEIAHHCS